MKKFILESQKIFLEKVRNRICDKKVLPSQKCPSLIFETENICLWNLRRIAFCVRFWNLSQNIKRKKEWDWLNSISKFLSKFSMKFWNKFFIFDLKRNFCFKFFSQFLIIETNFLKKKKEVQLNLSLKFHLFSSKLPKSMI